MNKIQKRRLYLIIGLITGISISVIFSLLALSKNINLFYTPTQIKNGEAPIEKTIRAGGMVVKNSISRSPVDLSVTFIVTDYNDNLTIKYKGILPDLFREEQGVVVLGKINDDGELIAEQVLAKHDENYMPPELSDALKNKEK